MSRIRQRKHYEPIVLVPGVPPGKGITGITFVPVMNSKTNITGARASQSLVATSVPLPSAFNWNSGATASKMCPVMNQGSCGGCWAFAIASALGDRYTLAQPMGIPPYLNPMYLMYLLLIRNETNAGAACKGGNVFTAAQTIETCGLIEEGTEFLSPEMFRQQNLADNDVSSLNQALEAAGNPYIAYLPGLAACVQAGDTVGSTTAITVRYLIEPGSTKQIFYDIADPESHASEIVETIKSDIFANGPVVTAFMVYNDFFAQTNWTRGPKGLVFIHEWLTPDTTVQPEGEHAVVIVGWDSQTMVNPLTGASELVPYWIVRNSWDTVWGDKGYFNFAMHPYNIHCGMDVPIQALNTDGVTQSLTGGVTVFQPAKSTLALLLGPDTPAPGPVAPTPAPVGPVAPGAPVVAPTPTPVVPVNPIPVNPTPTPVVPVVPPKPSAASSLAATRVVEATLITSVVILGICLGAWLIRRSRIRVCMPAPPSL